MHQTCSLAMKTMNVLPYTSTSFTCRLQTHTPQKANVPSLRQQCPPTFIRVVDASVCPGSLGSLKAVAPSLNVRCSPVDLYCFVSPFPALWSLSLAME